MVIDCVVAPFDQAYDAPLLAVSTTEPPAQNVVGPPAVIAGAGGFAFMVTVVGAEVALQPYEFDSVTLYEPDCVTTIDCVVSPVDQTYDPPALAVSITEPPAQNVVGPLALMVG